MPDYIDERWEFYVADPEVEEALKEDAPGFDGLLHAGASGNSGYRFGTGDPNGGSFRLAPEKPARSEKTPKSARKATGKLGAERRLPDRTCPQCGKVFRPKDATTVYDSMRCRDQARRKPPAPSGCPVCGGEVPPQRGPSGTAKVYCSPRCKHVKARREYRLRPTLPNPDARKEAT